jgi:CheY-like chemotaxis protein
MDNHMPIMDCIEASQMIRRILKLKTVLFGWTTDVFAESKKAFIDAGADQVLNKPLQKQFQDLLKDLRHDQIEEQARY